MSNWWDKAPIADTAPAAASGDWWESAPVADAELAAAVPAAAPQRWRTPMRLDQRAPANYVPEIVREATELVRPGSDVRPPLLAELTDRATRGTADYAKITGERAGRAATRNTLGSIGPLPYTPDAVLDLAAKFVDRTANIGAGVVDMLQPDPVAPVGDSDPNILERAQQRIADQAGSGIGALGNVLDWLTPEMGQMNLGDPRFALRGAADKLGEIGGAYTDARRADVVAENVRREQAGLPTLEVERREQWATIASKAMSDYGAKFSQTVMTPEQKGKERELGYAIEQGPIALLNWVVRNPGPTAKTLIPDIAAFLLPSKVTGSTASTIGRRGGMSEADAGNLGVTTALGTSAGTATMAAGQEAFESVMDAPIAELRKSPDFIALVEQGADELTARATLAAESYRAAMAVSAPINTALVGLGPRFNPLEAWAVKGGTGPTASRLANAGIVGGIGAATEFPQGYSDALAVNAGQVAAGMKDPSQLGDQALAQGLLEAIGGGGASTFAGATMGTAQKPAAAPGTPTPPPAATPPPIVPQAPAGAVPAAKTEADVAVEELSAVIEAIGQTLNPAAASAATPATPATLPGADPGIVAKSQESQGGELGAVIDAIGAALNPAAPPPAVPGAETAQASADGQARPDDDIEALLADPELAAALDALATPSEAQAPAAPTDAGGSPAPAGAVSILPESERDTAPVGSRVDGGTVPGMGRVVWEIQNVPLDSLILPEVAPDGTIPSAGRDVDAAVYAEAMRRGDTFPNARGFAGDDGRVKLADGHRRAVAARAAGLTSIPVAVATYPDLAPGALGDAVPAREAALAEREAIIADEAAVEKAKQPPPFVPGGKLYQRGRNDQAVQLADGTWKTRIRERGQWQAWVSRETFDASPAFGYRERTPPGGYINIDGKQIRLAPKDAPRPKTPDGPKKPRSLLEVLARGRGLDRAAFQAEGVDPKALATQAGFGYVFRKEGGMTPDEFRGMLVEEQYLPPDSPDRPDESDVDQALTLLFDALAGNDVFAFDQMGDVAIWEAWNEQAEQEWREETEAILADELPELDDADMDEAVRYAARFAEQESNRNEARDGADTEANEQDRSAGEVRGNQAQAQAAPEPGAREAGVDAVAPADSSPAAASRRDGAADADRLGLRDAVDAALGATGARVEFLRGYAGLPDRLRLGIQARMDSMTDGSRTAALYDPATRRVYVFTDVSNTPAIAVWQAAHEIAGHLGLRALLGDRLNVALGIAIQNPTVLAVAKAIALERGIDMRTEEGRMLAAEEALAELSAAVRTGDYGKIASRYNVTVPEGVRARLAVAVENFLKRLKAMMDDIFSRHQFTDSDVRELLENAWQAAKDAPMETAGQDGDGLESRRDADPAADLDEEQVFELLQEYGRNVDATADAEKAWTDGDLVFISNEMAQGDPYLAESLQQIRNAATDNMMVVRREDFDRSEFGMEAREPGPGGLFPAPTQRDQVEAARRDRDAQRDGRSGTGRTDMGAGRGDLFSGPRPQQADLDAPLEARIPADQTETPEFRRWFGDSKVVDAGGKPKRVFHGTTGSIDRFDTSRLGENTGAESAGMGFFFSDDARTAGSYANFAATDARVARVLKEAERAEKRGDWDAYDAKIVQAEEMDASFRDFNNRLSGQNIVPVYLSIENPLVVDAKGENAVGFDIPAAIRKAKRGGHDGLIIENLDDAAGLADVPATHYVTFRPTQIKSAIGNRGTFDPASPSILESRRPREPAFAVTPATTARSVIADGRVLSLVDAAKAAGLDLAPMRDAYTRKDAQGIVQALDDLLLALQTPKRATGIKNAVTDAERAAAGRDPILRDAIQTNEETVVQGMRALRDDPSAGDEAIARINRGGDLSLEDAGILLVYKTRLMNQRNAAADVLADPQASEARKDVARATWATTEAKMEALDRAASASGTEAGRMLQFRRRMLQEDFTLAALERKERARLERPLTAEESARIKEMADTIAALQAIVDALNDRISNAASEAAYSNVVDVMKGRAPKKRPSLEALRRAADEARARLRATPDVPRRGGQSGAIISPTAFYDYAVIGAFHIAEGATKFADWVSAMRADIGAAFDRIKAEHPNIFKAAQRELDKPIKADATVAEVLAGIDLANVKPKDVRKLVEAYVGEGLRGEPAVVAAVAKALDLDPSEVRTLFVQTDPRPTQTLTEAQQEIRDLRRIIRMEAEIARLEAGEPKPPRGAPAVDSPAVAAKKQELADLRARLRAAARPDPETRYQELRGKQIQKRIDDIEARIAAGDFEPRKRIPRALNDANNQAMFELAQAKENFLRHQYMENLKNRSPLGKVFGGIGDAFNLSRAVMTSFDLSALFRQGGFIVLGNPMRGVKGFVPMLRAFASARADHEMKAEIESRPNAPLYKKYGMELTGIGAGPLSQIEEAYASRWLERFPLLAGGGLIRGSGRAYTSFLNRLRADSFDAMVASLTKTGVPTDAEGKAIANYINVATGRGPVGLREKTSEVLNTVFFAPRLVASRFQLLVGMPLYGGSGRTRRMIVKEYARFLMGVGVVLGLAAFALGDDEDDKPVISFDARSPAFGKVRFGNSYIDPLAGLAQVTVFLGRMATGETVGNSGEAKPLRNWGTLTDLRRAMGQDIPAHDLNPDGSLPYGGSSSFDVIARFLRTKLAPAPGAIINSLSGENLIGEQVTPLQAAKELVTPMTFGDIGDAMEEHGVAKGAAVGLLVILGMSVNTRDEPSPLTATATARADIRDRLSVLPPDRWQTEMEAMRKEYGPVMDGVSLAIYKRDGKYGREGEPRRTAEGLPVLEMQRLSNAAAARSNYQAALKAKGMSDTEVTATMARSAVHHIIPDNVVRQHPLMIHARTALDYDLDRPENLVGLAKEKTEATESGAELGHWTDHPFYDMEVVTELDAAQRKLRQKHGSVESAPRQEVLDAIRRVEGAMRKRIEKQDVPKKGGRLAANTMANEGTA